MQLLATPHSLFSASFIAFGLTALCLMLSVMSAGPSLICPTPYPHQNLILRFKCTCGCLYVLQILCSLRL